MPEFMKTLPPDAQAKITGSITINGRRIGTTRTGTYTVGTPSEDKDKRNFCFKGQAFTNPQIYPLLRDGKEVGKLYFDSNSARYTAEIYENQTTVEYDPQRGYRMDKAGDNQFKLAPNGTCPVENPPTKGR